MQGAPYHGKPADVWALGCTLYVFVTGRYPFMTDSHALGDLYQAILHQEVVIPSNLSPDLQDLLRRLLEKDPEKRITVEEAALHPWLTSGLGPLLQVELRGKLLPGFFVKYLDSIGLCSRFSSAKQCSTG